MTSSLCVETVKVLTFKRASRFQRLGVEVSRNEGDFQSEKPDKIRRTLTSRFGLSQGRAERLQKGDAEGASQMTITYPEIYAILLT